MKKTAIPKVEISRVIWANIRKAQYLNCLSEEQLSSAFELTLSELNALNDNPSALTLGRLQILLDNMGISIKELLQQFHYRQIEKRMI